MRKDFFYGGGAVAAHQVEGGYNEKRKRSQCFRYDDSWGCW